MRVVRRGSHHCLEQTYADLERAFANAWTRKTAPATRSRPREPLDDPRPQARGRFKMSVYTAEPGSSSEQALNLLASRSATPDRRQ
jgi:hypothetical protein